MDDVINEQDVLRKEGRVAPRLHQDVAPDPLAYPLNDGMMSRDSLLELQRPWAGCAGVWRERYFDLGQAPRRLGVLCCVETVSADGQPCWSGAAGCMVTSPGSGVFASGRGHLMRYELVAVAAPPRPIDASSPLLWHT